MGKGHSPEQIVKKLRQAEGELANGSTIPEVARQLTISEATFHRWRNRYGGMSSQEAKRPKELERENARLKKLVAEKELDIDILKEVSRGNLSPANAPEKEGSNPRAENLRDLRASGLPGYRAASLHSTLQR